GGRVGGGGGGGEAGGGGGGGGDDVGGGGQGGRQVRVRAVEKLETRPEHDQGERTAGWPRPAMSAGQRVPDVSQQRPRAELLAGRPAARWLGEGGLAPAGPDPAPHPESCLRRRRSSRWSP